MADKRIVVVNRTLSTLSLETLANVRNGEWFYVEDRKCIYWKHLTTGEVQALTNATTVQGTSLSWSNNTYTIEGSDGLALESGKTRINFLAPEQSTGGNKVTVGGTVYDLYDNAGKLVELGVIQPHSFVEAIYIAGRGFQIISDTGSTSFDNGITAQGTSVVEVLKAEHISAKTYTSKIVDMGDGNVIIPSLGEMFLKTITGNTTLTIDTASAAELADSTNSVSVFLEITSGGDHIVQWGENIYWDNNIAPVLASGTFTSSIGFYSVDNGLTWRGVLISAKIGV